MIHLVTADNRRLYAHALRAMHVQRKTVFVDRMGWDVPVRGDLEIDQFDGADTIYLLAMDEQDVCELPAAPRASVRLLPSLRPHVLGALFSHLCPSGPPCGPSIWEASRLCLAPDAVAPAERRAMVLRMIVAVIETALLFDVNQISFVANAALAPLALTAGWRTRTLGVGLCAPVDAADAVGVRTNAQYDGACDDKSWAAAILADASPEDLRRVRAAAGLHAPVLRFAGDQARTGAAAGADAAGAVRRASMATSKGERP